MFESSVDEVAAGDVAALAAALLGLSAGEVLGGDLASAQAVVAATQRVLNAVSAVQVLGIEAWARRTVRTSRRTGQPGCGASGAELSRSAG